MIRAGRRSVLVPIIAALLAAPALLPAGAEERAPGADPLWRKAVDIVAANDDWTPGSIVFAAVETDGRGRTRSSWEVQILATRGTNGEPVQAIVRYVENGKDVTEEKRSADRGRTPGSSGSGAGSGGGPFSWNPSDPHETPFHPAVQEKVIVRRVDSGVLRDGRMCVAFAFEQALGERQKAVGTAWLDAATGAPVGMVATFEPLPPLVRRAELEVGFATNESGSWFVTSFHALGEVTVLLIHRAYAMDIAMREHWRLGQPLASR